MVSILFSFLSYLNKLFSSCAYLFLIFFSNCCVFSLFAKAGEYCKGEPDEGEADPKVYSNNLIKHEGLEPHPLDTFNEDLGKWKLFNVKSSYVCPVAWAVTTSQTITENIEKGAVVMQGALKGTLTKELSSGAATSFSITSTDDITFNTENPITIGTKIFVINLDPPQTITASAGVTVTQGSNTGTLKEEISGEEVVDRIVIETMSGVFVTTVDIVVDGNIIAAADKIDNVNLERSALVITAEAITTITKKNFLLGDYKIRGVAVLEVCEPTFHGDETGKANLAGKMNAMFFGATKFNPASLNLWDVKGVIDMSDMFGAENSQVGEGRPTGCFNGIISDWKTGKVVRMNRMFRGSKFDKDISKW